MTFRGTIENGRLVLDNGSHLPDGTRVDIEVDARKPRPARCPSPDTLGQITSLAVKTGDKSMADQHDRLAYGEMTPPKPTRKGQSRAAARAKVAKKKGKR